MQTTICFVLLLWFLLCGRDRLLEASKEFEEQSFCINILSCYAGKHDVDDLAAFFADLKAEERARNI